MKLNQLHRAVGLVTLIVFPLTGVLLRVHYGAPELDEDPARYTLRANHLYILWSGLANLLLGAYLRFHPKRWRRILQGIGSLLLLLAPLLLITAFFLEGPNPVPERPLTSLGSFLALLGTLIHLPRVS